MLLISYLIVVLFLHVMLRKKTSYFWNLLLGMRYNALIRFLIETYLPFMVSGLISIATVRY